MLNAGRSYMAEFLGTFTLVFIGTAVATLQGTGLVSVDGWGPAGFLAISFAFGFTLMLLVYAIGPISGCHINPAVTIPMALSGRLKWKLVPGYLIAQISGALVASLVLWALLSGITDYNLDVHGLGANTGSAKLSTGSLFGFELVMTALFLMVIFSVTKEGANPAGTGLAIGGFLFVAHLIGAQLGDSSLNPARSIGPAIFQHNALSVVWVFIVAPIAGGMIGWGLFALLELNAPPVPGQSEPYDVSSGE